MKNRNMDLTRLRSFLDEYLPDHRKLLKIQVAGTNGKGSTCMWISLLLQGLGYKVGLFTSPHLIVHNERIQINGALIPNEDLERLYDRFSDLFDEEGFTMFEMDLFLALAYFLEQRVDYAIMEVGLGGRLDATTALDYQATVLTNVGLEHTEILGDTLEQIAREKSGIFKSGVLAVTSEHKPVCQKVIEGEIRYQRAPFFYSYTPDYTQKGKKLIFEYMDGTLIFDQPLYQLSNFTLACDTLYHLGLRLRYPVLQGAIDQFHFQGRCMEIRKHPQIIVDGAHNLDGIQALVQSLRQWKAPIYFSVLKEKDASHMIQELEKLNGTLTLVAFESDRLYPLEQLGYEIISLEEMKKRLHSTKQKALICGSLYFVGEVLDMFRKKQ